MAEMIGLPGIVDALRNLAEREGMTHTEVLRRLAQELGCDSPMPADALSLWAALAPVRPALENLLRQVAVIQNIVDRIPRT